MKMKGWKTSHVEVDISDREIFDAAIELIKKEFSLTNVDRIEKGKMSETVEYHTSHSWFEREERGKATAEQKEAFGVIEFLKRMKS